MSTRTATLRTIIGFVSIACLASTASAQTRRVERLSYGPEWAHRLEIIPLGGYAWTSAFDVYTINSAGKLDVKDAGFFGVALDVTTMSPSARRGQIRLLYRRQSSKIQYRSRSLSEVIEEDASVEYWHIGGVGGVRQGNTLPFAAVTLGGTRLIAGSDDVWKFSLMLGLGVKVYVSPRVGLMLQGNWPFTFMDTWGGITIGSGGAGVTLGGSGVSQWDVGGGLVVCF